MRRLLSTGCLCGPIQETFVRNWWINFLYFLMLCNCGRHICHRINQLEQRCDSNLSIVVLNWTSKFGETQSIVDGEVPCLIEDAAALRELIRGQASKLFRSKEPEKVWIISRQMFFFSSMLKLLLNLGNLVAILVY